MTLRKLKPPEPSSFKRYQLCGRPGESPGGFCIAGKKRPGRSRVRLHRTRRTDRVTNRVAPLTAQHAMLEAPFFCKQPAALSKFLRLRAARATPQAG